MKIQVPSAKLPPLHECVDSDAAGAHRRAGRGGRAGRVAGNRPGSPTRRRGRESPSSSAATPWPSRNPPSSTRANQKLVYREVLPGEYEGVLVELGPRLSGPDDAGYYPVLGGLSAGERDRHRRLVPHRRRDTPQSGGRLHLHRRQRRLEIGGEHRASLDAR